MRRIVRPATIILCLAVSTITARAEDRADPASPPATPSAAATSGPLLGRAHVWVKAGRLALDDEAARAWGVDREGFLALEAYHGSSDGFYFGGEIGHARSGRSVSADGDTIRDLDLLWLELNGKRALDLRHGLTVDLGVGWALFYIDGEEVTMQGAQEVADPLADIGLGLQAFADLNWRVRRLLLGLNARYQWAYDLIDIDYSNLRVGAHIGLAF